MKKILATLAGVAALSLGLGACSAVDTQETKSAAPVAQTTSVVTPPVQRDLARVDYYGHRQVTRSATRPVKHVVKPSAHELHVQHGKLVEAKLKAKAVKKIVKAKRKLAKTTKVVKPTTKKIVKSTKKVSLSGIASCIAKYESGGNPRAQNPTTTASGLFQFVDGTWNNFKGYAKAKFAPVSVQLEKFYIVWDGGRGARNWVTAHKCGY